MTETTETIAEDYIVKTVSLQNHLFLDNGELVC